MFILLLHGCVLLALVGEAGFSGGVGGLHPVDELDEFAAAVAVAVDVFPEGWRRARSRELRSLAGRGRTSLRGTVGPGVRRVAGRKKGGSPGCRRRFAGRGKTGKRGLDFGPWEGLFLGAGRPLFGVLRGGRRAGRVERRFWGWGGVYCRLFP